MGKYYIKVNTETAKVIHDLCDVALKAGGINNLEVVSNLLNSISLVEPDMPELKSDEKSKE